MRRACGQAWPTTPFAKPQGVPPVGASQRLRAPCLVEDARKDKFVLLGFDWVEETPSAGGDIACGNGYSCRQGALPMRPPHCFSQPENGSLILPWNCCDGEVSMKPPTNPYHQPETVFAGERQEFSDAGLSPDDPTVQTRASRARPPHAKSESPKKKKRRKRG
jgi:hypothetical protein